MASQFYKKSQLSVFLYLSTGLPSQLSPRAGEVQLAEERATLPPGQRVREPGVQGEPLRRKHHLRLAQISGRRNLPGTYELAWP